MTPGNSDRSSTIAALRAAIPYLRLFQDRIFVIKAGGAIFEDQRLTRSLLEQVGVLHQLGIRTVVVHGGGGQTTTLAKKMGVETHFVDGRRVTSPEALQVAVMTMNGTVRTDILAQCRELEIPAMGLSGVDAGIIRARRRPPRRSESGDEVDYGLVGDIVAVDPAAILNVLDGGMVPILSPLCADDDGTVLNVNADVVAARLARELDAEKLIVATSAPGILKDAKDPSSTVSYTDVRGLNALVDEGAASEGMLPKVAAIKDALYGGVRRVHVVSWLVPDSLLLEVFTNEGSGTLVVLDTKDLLPQELESSERMQALMDGGQGA